jgi:hypothetical protein
LGADKVWSMTQGYIFVSNETINDDGDNKCIVLVQSYMMVHLFESVLGVCVYAPSISIERRELKKTQVIEEMGTPSCTPRGGPLIYCHVHYMIVEQEAIQERHKMDGSTHSCAGTMMNVTHTCGNHDDMNIMYRCIFTTLR